MRAQSPMAGSGGRRARGGGRDGARELRGEHVSVRPAAPPAESRRRPARRVPAAVGLGARAARAPAQPVEARRRPVRRTRHQRPPLQLRPRRAHQHRAPPSRRLATTTSCTYAVYNTRTLVYGMYPSAVYIIVCW